MLGHNLDVNVSAVDLEPHERAFVCLDGVLAQQGRSLVASELNHHNRFVNTDLKSVGLQVSKDSLDVAVGFFQRSSRPDQPGEMKVVGKGGVGVRNGDLAWPFTIQPPKHPT